jgi:hypothetical protein
MINKYFKKTLIVSLFIVIIFMSYGIYYVNNIYGWLGKTNWNYRVDGDKGRQVIEKSFLGEKLPINAKDLKYQTAGYCGLDCFAIFSVEVDQDYYKKIVQDKCQLQSLNKKPIIYQNDPNFWQNIPQDSILSKPLSIEQIVVDNCKSEYPGFLWYAQNRLNYYKLVQ